MSPSRSDRLEDLIDSHEQHARWIRAQMALIQGALPESEKLRAWMTRWEEAALLAEHQADKLRRRRETMQREVEDGIQKMIDDMRWKQ